MTMKDPLSWLHMQVESFPLFPLFPPFPRVSEINFFLQYCESLLLLTDLMKGIYRLPQSNRSSSVYLFTYIYVVLPGKQ